MCCRNWRVSDYHSFEHVARREHCRIRRAEDRRMQGFDAALPSKCAACTHARLMSIDEMHRKHTLHCCSHLKNLLAALHVTSLL